MNHAVVHAVRGGGSRQRHKKMVTLLLRPTTSGTISMMTATSLSSSSSLLSSSLSSSSSSSSMSSMAALHSTRRRLLTTKTTSTTTSLALSAINNRSLLFSSSSFFSSVASSANKNENENENSSSSVNDDDDTIKNTSKHYKIAIVGSGPSGCYTAKYLLQSMKKLNTETPPNESTSTQNSTPTITRYYSCTIDILERLPTPYGLVRNGVAPDHPEVKNVQNDFNDLFNLNNNIDCSVQFYGNVTVGGNDRNDNDNDNKRSNDSNSAAAAAQKANANANANKADISLNELRSIYDIVVLAYGCESDREFHLPIDIIEDEDSNDDTTTTDNTTDIDTSSSEVDGIVSARQFVNWYNGHPDYGNEITTEVQNALWNNKNDNDKDNETETDETIQQQHTQEQNIVIIGHGNVALDCGRILAKSRQQLNTTDLTTRSLNILRPADPNPDPELDSEVSELEHHLKHTNEQSSSSTSTTQSSSTQPQRNISIIGRRGHIQGAFTIKEVRELTKLNNDNDNGNNDKNNENENKNENKKDNDVLFVVRQEELDMGMTNTTIDYELKNNRPKQRIHKLLLENATSTATFKSNKTGLLEEEEQEQQDNDNDSSNYKTRVDLRFLLNPIRYEVIRCPIDSGKLRLKSIICERTQLVEDDSNNYNYNSSNNNNNKVKQQYTPQQQKAIGTGIYEKIKADLCLVSIGYKGLPIDDYTTQHFNLSKGILLNQRGRVTTTTTSPTTNVVDSNDVDNNDNVDNNALLTLPLLLAPVYVSGWLKRGPSGIIGTNINDAKETVQSIIEDIMTTTNTNTENIENTDSNTTCNDNENKNEELVSSSSSLSLSLEDILNERNIQYINWNGYYNKINKYETGEIEEEDDDDDKGDYEIDDEGPYNTQTQTQTYQPKKRRHRRHQKRHMDQPREKIVDRAQLIEIGTTSR